MSDIRGSGEPEVWQEDDDAWTEEDERRYQQRIAGEQATRQRRRRHTVVLLLVLLVVMLTGVYAAGLYQQWWQWPPFSGDEAASETVQPCPTAVVTAAPPEQVQLVVLNSTDRAGLAGGVAGELQARAFVVTEIGNDPGEEPLPDAAVVRHGPEGLPFATTVAAHVDGATLVDDGRAGTAVELSLGEAYTALRTPEAVAALLVPQVPPSPAGCVVPTPADPAVPVDPNAPVPAPAPAP